MCVATSVGVAAHTCEKYCLPFVRLHHVFGLLADVLTLCSPALHFCPYVMFILGPYCVRLVLQPSLGVKNDVGAKIEATIFASHIGSNTREEGEHIC